MSGMKKAASKSKKKGDVDVIVKNNNKTVINSSPTEEEIREKAKEIYLQRIDRGENGTAEDDWLEAKKYFNNPEDYLN
jgi:hypothetical protein